MEVFENEHGGTRIQRAKFADQTCGASPGWWASGRELSEEAEGRFAEVRLDLAGSRDDVVRPCDDVRIRRIESIPERPHAGDTCKVGQERRLAVARLRDEQGQPMGGCLAELV